MGKIIGNVGAFHRWRCGTKTAPRWWSAGGARQSMDEQQCEFRMGAATERERETARVSRQGRGAWPWQPFIGLGEGAGSRRWRERGRAPLMTVGESTEKRLSMEGEAIGAACVCHGAGRRAGGAWAPGAGEAAAWRREQEQTAYANCRIIAGA